ncbi:unnamed protein product [Blepharisma stoltei]|uniref:Uncharacterized protein n=1 Tax=Blepharisma stoltei TaxID=1481888 RepID=A0AAU9K8J4_9CILI|nr:unnamed protein product [Blepharisma stoltei]
MSGDHRESIPSKRDSQGSERRGPQPAKKAKIIDEDIEVSDEEFVPDHSDTSEEVPSLLSDEEEHGEDEDFDFEGYRKFREQDNGQNAESSESGEEESGSEESAGSEEEGESEGSEEESEESEA